MKDDEYIDLDKINESPKEGQIPGLSKEERQRQQENKPKNKKKTKKTNTKSKKTTNTTTKTKTKQKKQNNNKKTIYLLLGLILIAILVIAISNILRVEDEPKERKVLLLVNGEPLSNEIKETRAEWLRLVGGVPLTDEQALELSVDVKLMEQEAKRQNITVQDREVEAVFLDMALNAEMTDEELEEYIAGLGIDYNTLKEVVRQELYARKLSDKALAETEITEEDLKQFYEENKENFEHGELAKVRHIQISFEENKTENETMQKAQEIKQKITENKTNFCELVENYTDDWNTRDTCGEYVLEKHGAETDPLTNKSFELEEDELGMLRTEAGYHVLWKVETIPAGVSEFEEVKEIIKAQIQMQLAEQIHNELVQRLRETATIEDYTGQEKIPEDTIDVMPDEIINETEEIVNETDVVDEVVEPVEELINETEELINETEELEEEPIEEELEEPIITIEETTLETEKRQLRLAKCLTEQDAKMYDVYWAPHGQEQAEAFGEYFEYIKRIECDADGTNPQIQECQETLQREYPTWPTWKINGELHEGYHNLHSLSRISGCPY